MSSVMLALDGQAILLQNMTVSVSLEIADKDQSGQTSSSSTSEQGIKPKALKVSGLIPFKFKERLTSLFELATAKGGNGELKKYRIANETAQAISLREAVFSGNIDVTQQSDKLAWSVTFSLKEKLTVSEKRDERQITPDSQVQGRDNLEDSDKEMNWFEKNILAPVNRVLE